MGIVVTNFILFIMTRFDQTGKSLDAVNKWFDSVLMFSGGLVNLFISSEMIFFCLLYDLCLNS